MIFRQGCDKVGDGDFGIGMALEEGNREVSGFLAIASLTHYRPMPVTEAAQTHLAGRIDLCKTNCSTWA